MPVVETSALTKRFRSGGDEVVAVEDLDLEIPQGEIFGLLGPNGAGKTTTIGMLTTRVVPTAGRASVGGVDVVARPAAAKSVLGVVPQTNTHDRSLSVRDNLYYHGRYFGFTGRAARRRADELLEQFRLAERATAMVNELSGGMAQRLMVARAVFHRPAVLFLDEPTAGLDPQSRLALWDVVSEMHSAGQTVLLTTHYMEEADTLCARVAIMDHGRLLALGTPDELKASVGADTVVDIAFAGSPDGVAGKLRAMPLVDDVEEDEHRFRIYARTGDGVVVHLLEAAVDAGVEVTDLSVRPATLETVFIRLTGRELRE